MSEKQRKTNRDLQAEKSRNRIYETALKLFSDKGIDSTSISEICRSAGCSVGAFYHHFPSKDSVIEETFKVADEDFLRWREQADHDLNSHDLIVAYMKSYAELNIRSGLEFCKRFFTANNKIFVRKGRPMQTCLIQIINEAVESGELKIELSPEEACEWIFMNGRGVVLHWCLHEAGFDLVEKMEICTIRALKGLAIES